MVVTCTPAGNMQTPSQAQRERCETVVEGFEVNTVNHDPRISTFVSTGDDPRWDVRLDNEGVIEQDGVYYARLRIQGNIRPTSPTFAVILVETSPRQRQEGPFFGQNRLRAALRASLVRGATIWMRVDRR